MPAGLTFWRFPVEEETFLTFLQKTGKIYAFHLYPVDRIDELEPLPLMEFIARFQPYRLFIGLEQFCIQRTINTLVENGKTRYYIAKEPSCLMAYRRGAFRTPNELGQCTLGASWDRLNESQTALLAKDGGFRKWGEKVLRWVRKSTPEWHQVKGYRVTSQVKKAIDAGQIKIVP
jgi:hypothetical protein